MTARHAHPHPTIEIRLTATYAWLLMGFGAVFFLLSFLVGRQNTPLAILIAVLSIGAIIGGNYWRHNLHVVARLTPRQLVLQRGGTVNWTDIAAIDKKTIHAPNHGVVHRSEFVCIKLSVKRPTPPGLEGLLAKVKSAVLAGYDIIVPESELSCTADWFIAECKKRMAS